MTDTVYMAPEPGRRRRSSGVFIPPLLVIPFLIYNLVGLVFYGGDPDRWTVPVMSIPMVSGQAWTLTSGDLILVLGLVCLFFEAIKSTNTGRNSVIEHMVSVLLFVAFLVEFILVGACASSVFFLLMVMSAVDVVAGFTISITGAGRDVTMGGG